MILDFIPLTSTVSISFYFVSTSTARTHHRVIPLIFLVFHSIFTRRIAFSFRVNITWQFCFVYQNVFVSHHILLFYFSKSRWCRLSASFQNSASNIFRHIFLPLSIYLYCLNNPRRPRYLHASNVKHICKYLLPSARYFTRSPLDDSTLCAHRTSLTTDNCWRRN